MTSITDQYRIITSRAGWADRGTWGRLKFSGGDVLPFLQGLLTNDVAGLQTGQGVYAAWLTALGRMNADIVLLHRGDRVIGLVGEGRGAELATRFDQLIFAEDVSVTDVSSDYADVFVTGGAAAEVVAAATGAQADALETLAELAQQDVDGGFVVRVGDSTLPAFRVIVEAARHDQLLAGLAQAGAVVMSEPLVTALRIEAGRGQWGADLSDDVIPLEAGLLERAISTSKGCYVGQEIVIRILHRGGGRVAKRLVILAFEPAVAEAPASASALEADGKTVGHVTSAAWSPARGNVVALGYLHRDVAEVGRQVVLAGTRDVATVTGFAG